MKTGIGLLILAAMAAGGCAQAVTTRADQYERGLVVCLSGAGGMMGECERLRNGLAEGGVDRAIEIFEWSQGGVLADQTDVAQNHRKAAQLARRIEGYLGEHPGRPVHLVGVSAGTGIAVWTAEELAEGRQITGLVLVSSSLDTRYDLSKAMAKVTDRIYSFNSVADTVLSLGVTWAGTVDRGGGLAGGLVGFSPPDKASEATKALYKEKLREFSWWPGDIVLGNPLGDHLGATNRPYVRAKIAPLVLGTAAEAAAESRQSEQDRRLEEARKALAEKQAALEKKPADDAKAGEAKPSDDDRRAAEEKKAEDAKKAAVARQAEEAKRALEGKGAAEKSSMRRGDRSRFSNWSVMNAAALPPVRPSAADEGQFFAASRRLP